MDQPTTIYYCVTRSSDGKIGKLCFKSSGLYYYPSAAEQAGGGNNKVRRTKVKWNDVADGIFDESTLSFRIYLVSSGHNNNNNYLSFQMKNLQDFQRVKEDLNARLFEDDDPSANDDTPNTTSNQTKGPKSSRIGSSVEFSTITNATYTGSNEFSAAFSTSSSAASDTISMEEIEQNPSTGSYDEEKNHPTSGTRRSSTSSCFRKSMIVLGVVGVLTTILGCYLAFGGFQRNTSGNADSVDSFLVEFGDKTIPSLGFFNGCYDADDSSNEAAGRYSQARTDGGTFAFCSELGRWTVYDSSSIEGGDECNDYIAKSEPTTRTLGIIEAGKLQWYTKGDEPLEFLQLTKVNQCENNESSRVPPSDACEVLHLDGTLHEPRSSYYEMVELPGNDTGHLQDPTLSHAIYFGKSSSEVILFTGRRWVITNTERLSSKSTSNNNKTLSTISDIAEFFYTDKLFNVKDQDKNWVSLISEEVTSVKDQGTPLGLRWYYPRYEEEGYHHYSFPSADLSRPVDDIFTCAAVCDENLNPCFFGGACQKNGKCLCSNGASGALCQEIPLGNGECDTYFNEDMYDFDGGDCCGSTCEGGLCGISPTSFNLFGLEGIVTANPEIFNNYALYDTRMGIIAADDYVKRYECQDPEMAAFTIEIKNSEEASSVLEEDDDDDWSRPVGYDADVASAIGCMFGSVSVRCDGKLYLQTSALLFPHGSNHCNQSHVEVVHVPHGANCELTMVDPPATVDYGFDYGVALYYGDDNNSTAIWENQGGRGEVTWDVPTSQCLTNVLSNITVDIFNASSAPGTAINRLSADGFSDDRCNSDANMVKERYFLALLDQSDLFPSTVWDVDHCKEWGWIECNNNSIVSLRLSSTQERPSGGTLPTEISLLSHLETLYLSVTNLNGTIPKELGNLTALNELYLHSNDLAGPIPKELGNLTALTSLGLSLVNPGPIPWSLGSLSHLERLDLRNINLNGTIPIALGRLTALTSLDLSSNELKGTIPSELGNLTALTHLDLSGNDLKGAIASELGKLQQLDLLSLHTNFLIGTVPSEIGALTALNWLSLSSNDLLGAIPSEIGHLTALTELHLSLNDLSGAIPKELGNLTALDKLVLYDNNLNGELPSELGKLTALALLVLYENDLNGTIPSEVGKLTALAGLILDENDLNGPIPEELGNLIALIQLGLHSNDLSGTIPKELGNLAALKYLYLNSNDLTGTIPTELAELEGLQVLSLYNNSLTGSIPKELSNLSALYEISLSLNDLGGPMPNKLTNLQGWPGHFPSTSNEITINIQTDWYPEQTAFEWSKRNESGLWQVLDFENLSDDNSVHTFTKEVQSDTLYKLRISDSRGDGILNGWATITSSTPSQNFEGGTLIWEASGSELKQVVVASVLVDSSGHANVEGYTLEGDESVLVPGTAMRSSSLEHLGGKGHDLIQDKDALKEKVRMANAASSFRSKTGAAQEHNIFAHD